MFLKKHGWKVQGLLLVFSMVLAACGGDGEPADANVNNDGNVDNGEATGEEEYNWRFALEESPDSVQDHYAQEFASRLEEKSDGQINIDIYPAGQLGGLMDTLEMLQQGEIELAIVSPGNTGTIVPEAQVFELQYLFPDDMELTQSIIDDSTAIQEHLADLYAENNILTLDYWVEGHRQWTSGNHPLRTPDDFDGFNMRTMESPLIVESYEAYGASPTPMDWAELYTGLQQGQVDGQENPIFFIEEEAFYEVQDYMTISNHNVYTTTTSMNPDYFESLPEDIQDLIMETIEEMKPVALEIQDELNAERLSTIEDYGTEIIELNAEEREAFRELAEPVRSTYADLSEDAAQILEELEQEIEAAQ